MTRPRLLVLSLGGTITMVPSDAGGTGTYGYAGGEIDLLGRGVVPAGSLSGLKARILLGLALHDGRGADAAREAFRRYA
jgi:L-asparaginase/Glu-tRNA(Gln) amidotransferase subunit D